MTTHRELVALLECRGASLEGRRWLADKGYDLAEAYHKVILPRYFLCMAAFLICRYEAESFHKRIAKAKRLFYGRIVPQSEHGWHCDDSGRVLKLLREAFPLEEVERAAQRQLRHHLRRIEAKGACAHWCYSPLPRVKINEERVSIRPERIQLKGAK